MRKVIGVGETILDIIFQKNQPHAAVPGGSVFNGMVSLSRLGIPVSFISEVGDDRVGRIVTDFMKENQMETKHIDYFPGARSPISLAFLDDSKNAEYLFYTDYPAQRLSGSFPQINQDDIVIFGSYYALNPVLRDRILELLEYAKEQKAIIYYDPNFRKAHAHDAIRVRPTVMENYEFATIARGSDEDFLNLYGKTDMDQVYKEEVQFYCKKLITTHRSDGVNLYTENLKLHFDVPQINPISTVGAGDNFNAGIIFGLLKYKIGYHDIPTLGETTWEKIIQCGIDLASEVCQNYANYISTEFAAKYSK